jgi:hypothetical protein
MQNKLTEAQLALLQAGAQNEDRFIVALTGAKGAAAKKTAAKLIEACFVKELKAKPGVPIWRVDGETGQTYALKLTAAGFRAASAASKPAVGPVAGSIACQQDVKSDAPATREPEATANGSAAPVAASMPREGSKIATVLTLLRKPGGATIEELVTATGWLPHTTRAALTGLRKRGVRIERAKEIGKQASSYLVVDGAAAAEAARD